MRRSERISRFQSGAGLPVGIVFLVLGLFVVMPKHFGFGLVWTLLACAFMAFCAVSAYSARRPRFRAARMRRLMKKRTPEQKRKLLDELYQGKLITQEEYEKKKKEISGEEP